MGERNEEDPVKSILRPLMSFVLHKSSISAVNSYMDKVASILSLAKIDVTVSHAAFRLPTSTHITNTTDLVSILRSTFVSKARMTIKAPSSTSEIAIGVESSVTQTQNMSSTFAVSIPGGQPLNFDDVEDLAQSADVAIASLVAAALRSASEQSWQLDQREALLTLEERGRERRQVWVIVDSQEGRVALSSLQKDLAWEQGKDSPGAGLWEGWSDVASETK